MVDHTPSIKMAPNTGWVFGEGNAIAVLTCACGAKFRSRADRGRAIVTRLHAEHVEEVERGR